jgi:cytochrome c556
MTDSQKQNASSVAAWCAATLVAGGLLAFVMGSATPRIRLIGIYPLALGAFAAAGCIWLLGQMKLTITPATAAWIVAIAAAVHVGSTVQSWRIWKDALIREHAGSMGRMNQMLKDAEPEFRQETMRAMALRLRVATELQAYLSQRLEVLSRALNRNAVWDSPVPQFLFTAEICVAGIAALVTILASAQSGPWSPPPADPPEEEAHA